MILSVTAATRVWWTWQCIVDATNLLCYCALWVHFFAIDNVWPTVQCLVQTFHVAVHNEAKSSRPSHNNNNACHWDVLWSNLVNNRHPLIIYSRFNPTNLVLPVALVLPILLTGHVNTMLKYLWYRKYFFSIVLSDINTNTVTETKCRYHCQYLSNNTFTCR